MFCQDVYDDCPLQPTPKQGASLDFLAHAQGPITADAITGGAGGYTWQCEPVFTLGTYFERPDVAKALHLPEPNLSAFGYNTSGPASVTLYPDLIKHLRVLIYNGDADSCVPYKGNEEWITDLKTQKLIAEQEPWRPW